LISSTSINSNNYDEYSCSNESMKIAALSAPDKFR